MNDKLLPCPFCGGEAIAFPCAGQYYAKCVLCQIEVVRNNPEEAYAAWNCRTPNIIHCGECEHKRKCDGKAICGNGLAGGSANVNTFMYGETIAHVVTDTDFCSKGVRKEIRG